MRRKTNHIVARLLCLWIVVGGLRCTAKEPENSPTVESAPPAGPLVYRGDVLVQTDHDLARLAGYVEIQGKLVVKRAVIRELVLPTLASVQGRLYIQKNNALVDVSLPALQRVGLHGGDDLAVERNQALTALNLGSLQQVFGGLKVRQNPALKEMNLNALKQVGDKGVAVSDNSVLETLALPSLEDALSVEVERCAVLKRTSIPLLTNSAHVAVRNNPVLTALELDRLETLYKDPSKQPQKTGLHLEKNLALSTLQGLGRLRMIGRHRELVIKENMNLSSCEAEKLKEKLWKSGWKGEDTRCGNRPDGCEEKPCF